MAELLVFGLMVAYIHANPLSMAFSTLEFAPGGVYRSLEEGVVLLATSDLAEIQHGGQKMKSKQCVMKQQPRWSLRSVYYLKLNLLIGYGIVIALCSCSRMQDSLDSAEYAPQYSEESFKAIIVGDSKESAIERIGEPLYIRTARWDSDRQAWRFGGNYTNNFALYVYSASTNDSHYRQRSLVFDLDKEVVIYKISRFYID